MQTSYIYSVSRTNTLSEYLLTRSDIERLLVASPGAELQSALKETYLAPYLTRLDDEDVTKAIELTLIDAKRLVHSIAPAGDMFRVLWVHYDIHNLRVFAKAKQTAKAFAELAPYLSQRGVYEPVILFENAENSSLNSMQIGWKAQETYDKAVALVHEGKLEQVDALFDELYFVTACEIAKKSSDSFIQSYMVATINLYNAKSRLRALTHTAVAENAAHFILGGTISKESLETKEDVLSTLAQLGTPGFFDEAIAVYNKTGNTTQLDVAADEYLITLAKEGSRDMFSAASLVLYYLLCRQSAANVRTIVVGKNNGIDNDAIRSNLRMAYVNE